MTTEVSTNTEPFPLPPFNAAPLNGIPIPTTIGVTPLPSLDGAAPSPSSSAKQHTPTLVPSNTPLFPMDTLSLATGISTNSFAVKKGAPIIRRMQPLISARKPFYSFEYFPPKTREGVDNLYDRLDRMSQLEPLFMDLTWGAGGSTADLTLEISGNGQQMCSGEIMMHLTCTNLPRQQVYEALEKAKQLGIRNILALRGDPPKGSEAWEACEDGFANAVELVQYIRSHYGDYFGVAVAGYPEGHVNAKSIDDDIAFLKLKCDAGADFIITQLFYDVDIFLAWVDKCRAVGITQPIIPGIMPIQNYTGFKRMTSFCLGRDSAVTMASGLAVRIGDLANVAPAAVLTYDADAVGGDGFRSGTMSNWLEQGVRDCVTIALQDGRELTCTPDHKLLTTIGWVEAQHLRLAGTAGEHRIICGVEGPTDEPAADGSGDFTFHLSARALSLRHDRLKVLALAAILGRLCSDGTINPDGRARLHFGHLLDAEAACAALDVIGVCYTPPRHQLGEQAADDDDGDDGDDGDDSDDGDAAPPRGDVYYVLLPAEFGRDVLAITGEPGGKRLDTAVLPQFVIDVATPLSVVREFLAGYYGGDGGALAASRTGFMPVRFYVGSSTQPAAIEAAQCMLTQLGNVLATRFGVRVQVVSYKVKKGGTGIEHVLSHPTESTLTFYEQVGFRFCGHKQARLMVAATYYRMLRTAGVQKKHAHGVAEHHRLTAVPRLSCVKARAKIRPRPLANFGYIFHPNVIESSGKLGANFNLGYDVTSGIGLGRMGRKFRQFIDEVGAAAFFPLGARTGRRHMKTYAVSRSRESLPYITLNVVDRRPARAQPVYDITVDDTHNFLANGVTVHNCKTAVPQLILDRLEPIKSDDAKVKQFGIELGAEMCRRLLAAGIPGLHFYTLNLERSVTNILEDLGFVNQKQNGRLPWKQSLVARRQKEEVRPIFWANRPQSYLDRTIHWTSYPEASWSAFSQSRYVTTGRRGKEEAEKDDFPNSRWGDRTSPAFGDLSDYHLCNFRTGTATERRKLWGHAPTSTAEIFNVFAAYIDGDVPRLPWCENAIQLETLPLKDTLRRINQSGFLTINSQPRVNGAPSSDPAVGWGGSGGYVYQKAYLEFFCSQELLRKLMAAAESWPSLTYTAVSVRGEVQTNISQGERTVNAVTWGVFPNKEIIQPTIVDVDSFMAWKDEAFALWVSQWRDIYPEGSDSWRLIDSIRDSYFLVNIVDNDYVKGDMFAFFAELLQQ